MDLDIGQDVHTKDGDKIGTIERLVVLPEHYEVRGFVVKEGTFFPEDKMVELAHVDHVDDEGVYLDVTKEQASELPAFVRENYYASAPEGLHAISTESWAGSAAMGGVAAAGPYEAETEANQYSGHLMHRDSLSEDALVLTHGTDVYDSQGEKVGNVDEILYSNDNFASAFIVEAGFLFHHDIWVPIDWVVSIAEDQIVLRKTKDECEMNRFDRDDA